MSASKRKLSFNEKRELEQLELTISKLEEQKSQLESDLNSGELPHDKLYEKSAQLSQLKNELDDKETRWLELSELI